MLAAAVGQGVVGGCTAASPWPLANFARAQAAPRGLLSPPPGLGAPPLASAQPPLEKPVKPRVFFFLAHSLPNFWAARNGKHPFNCAWPS
jgi:hypothetical protein